MHLYNGDAQDNLCSLYSHQEPLQKKRIICEDVQTRSQVAERRCTYLTVQKIRNDVTPYHDLVRCGGVQKEAAFAVI